MTTPQASQPLPSDGPVPGVLAAPPEGTWSLTRHDPGEMLAPYVSWLWSVDWDLTEHGDHVQATLPHPSAHLVVENGSATVHGPTSTRFERVLSGQGRATAIRFRPGGLRPLIDHAMTELLDHSRPAQQVLPNLTASKTARLISDIEAAGDADAALDLLESAAEQAIKALPASTLSQPDPLVAEVEALIGRIVDDRSITSVSALAAAVGRHPRSLQRLFADYVGIGPKAVIQRYRIQDAATIALSGGPVDWADVAADLGYYDQAHLVRDFTAVIGLSPSRYAAHHRGTTHR